MKLNQHLNRPSNCCSNHRRI